MAWQIWPVPLFRDEAYAERDLDLADGARGELEPGEHAECCPRCGSLPLFDAEPEDVSCWTCGWEPAT